MSSNSFEGVVPSGLGNLQKLKYLDFRCNSFSGDVMDLLSELGSVVHFDLNSNRFSGSLDLGMAEAGFISSIKYFNVSHNSLVGQLFAHDGVPYFDSLEVFDASYDQLTGTIPPFGFAVVSLKIIRLGSNQLSGSLVQETSMVLSELDLSLNQIEANNFTGPIPLQEIRDFAQNLSLMSLDLSHNFLDGYFPPEIIKFHNLVYLNLSNSKLEGNLPVYLPCGLKGFDVSFNNLSGVVPDDLRQLPDSAFRPGNSLLVIPYLTPSPKVVTDPTMRECRSCLKSTFKIALIACMVGAATLIAIFCMLVYYKAHSMTSHGRSLKGNEVRQQVSSISHRSVIGKNAGQPLSSFDLHQHPLPSPQVETAYHADTSSGLKMTNERAELTRKDEGLPFPVSILLSSNPSPSKSQISYDNLDEHRVYSPDKLAGDLYICLMAPNHLLQKNSQVLQLKLLDGVATVHNIKPHLILVSYWL